ncbi:class IIb bacteriocin, lactobin A/cerein 7B family [Shewanella sp. 202IG2-18]|nr:class IIb bacteriocin, lactobin A/cerein 7B family [Parashewanella hymeniacidonis]MBM7073177.1 class IIb bacteriocin, lactobin A/cerein 7B family [Parashewanella hymeniacidonis]
MKELNKKELNQVNGGVITVTPKMVSDLVVWLAVKLA